MSKTYNFYCDESTHIQHDGQPFMLLSYVSTPYHQLKLHNTNIREMKIKHHFNGEMKWSSLSKSQYPFYNEVIEYFFATDLHFRAIVIDKSKMKDEDFEQSHEDFYDKMYYQLLSKKIFPEHTYNVYMDMKDTNSYKKARNLKLYLERDYHNIRTLQTIRSQESELMQIADVLMGAINYKLRGLNKVTAKNNIIEKIEKHSKLPINLQISNAENSLNLFLIEFK